MAELPYQDYLSEQHHQLWHLLIAFQVKKNNHE